MALVQYTNEYRRLLRVALYRPGFGEIEQHDAAAAMYLDIPDPHRVLAEFDGIVQALRGLGVEVVVLEPAPELPPTNNMIFLRDVAFAFGDKLVLANMKHPLRQAEPAKFRQLLMAADPGYAPHFVPLTEPATMEGADLLVLDGQSVCAYVGSRTNRQAVEQLQTAFPGLTAVRVEANISGVPQHILGAVHILDERVASRRVTYCQDRLPGFDMIDFAESSEIKQGFSLNILTLAPHQVLMPAGNPHTKSALEARGITCHELEISEIHKMGGGLACMTLPLAREQ